MAGDYHTKGNLHPSSRQVRALCKNPDGSQDKIGGTTLLQVDAALRNGWGIDLDTRIGTAAPTWELFMQRINSGQGAILQGGYAPIHGTRFQGSETFRGNHAMFIAPGFVAMDPLCDGRRPGIYKFHGEPYPIDLLRRFAGALELTPGGAKLGLGKAWAAFTVPHLPPQYRVRIPKGTTFWLYDINTAGVVVGRRAQTTGGFSADCIGPRWYPWPGHGNVRLVRLTSGGRKGFGVETKWADEI
jgi:hypothetical protein